MTLPVSNSLLRGTANQLKSGNTVHIFFFIFCNSLIPFCVGITKSLKIQVSLYLAEQGIAMIFLRYYEYLLKKCKKESNNDDKLLSQVLSPNTLKKIHHFYCRTGCIISFIACFRSSPLDCLFNIIGCHHAENHWNLCL